MKKEVAIIGGGAAGFFTAINLAEKSDNVNITIYEGSNKVLSKVLVSGGGRCNVTNKVTEPKELIKNYPRGKEFLEPVFDVFSSQQTQEWFTQRGVPLKTEDDGRVFPVSDSSTSIYNCLTDAVRQNGISLRKSIRLTAIGYSESKWHLSIGNENIVADYLVLCTGSNPTIYNLLKDFGIKIVAPVPSLFTLKAANHQLINLAGLSVPSSTVNIKEIKNSISKGPLLVTHWGYSAPAILKMSAWYARELAALNYQFTLCINWNSFDEGELTSNLLDYAVSHPKDKVLSWKEHGLPKRLWHYVFSKSNLREFTNWSEIGKKGIGRLINQLCSYEVKITGKSTFKEEFVTAGGIDLIEINSSQLNVSQYETMYAAGEVLNIDAITGGYNFQAAWSGAYVIARDIASKVNC